MVSAHYLATPWVGKSIDNAMDTCQHSLGLQHAGLDSDPEVDMAGSGLGAINTP